METCVCCGFESDDRAAFMGDRELILCIPCHLTLVDESNGNREFQPGEYQSEQWHEIHYAPPGWEMVSMFAGMKMYQPKQES
jgi:hypothetical protein